MFEDTLLDSSAKSAPVLTTNTLAHLDCDWRGCFLVGYF